MGNLCYIMSDKIIHFEMKKDPFVWAVSMKKS